MKVLVYGGGAVGLGIASCLLKGGAQVDILTREQTARDLQKDGLIRTGIFGDYHAWPARFGSYHILGQVPRQLYDFILVCTKSYDSLNAAKDLYHHKYLLGEDTRIVLFQNGWGNAEIFCNYFDKERIYNARVITGFRRRKNNYVIVTVHADSIHIGSLFCDEISPVEDLCRLITRGDIPAEATDCIEKDLWAKMLYNCALNGLGAILNVPYGQLARTEPTRRIMNEIVAEVFAVIEAAGYKTHWRHPEQFLEVFYGELVPETADHKSSTLQDIIAKKKTEIDALNGAVIKLAHKHNVDVPYNSVVYNIVKFAEARPLSNDGCGH